MHSRIIVTDDDSDDVYFIQRRLTKAGVVDAPLTFSDGADLISFLDQNRAQATSSKYILILDLKMSMVNGFDVLTWLRRQPEYAATRVAVVTASPLESDRARAEASGANAYYEKFPEPEDLRQFLSRMDRDT